MEVTSYEGPVPSQSIRELHRENFSCLLFGVHTVFICLPGHLSVCGHVDSLNCHCWVYISLYASPPLPARVNIW